MGKLDASQVTTLGAEIAQEHLRDKGSINDLLHKMATERGWNPEQIRRVGRKANVSVFEKKFAAMSKDPDRIVAFDMGDPDEVIRRIQDASTTKVAAYVSHFPELPDQIAALRQSDEYEIMPEQPSVKVAMENAVENTQTLEVADHYRSAHEKLHERCGVLENRWVKQLHKVASMTRVLGWNHEQFEDNAVACFGAEVLDELEGVRQVLDLPPVEFDKTAAEHALENTLGHDTPETEVLKVAMELRSEIIKTRKARDLARETYQSIEKAVAR